VSSKIGERSCLGYKACIKLVDGEWKMRSLSTHGSAVLLNNLPTLFQNECQPQSGVVVAQEIEFRVKTGISATHVVFCMVGNDLFFANRFVAFMPLLSPTITIFTDLLRHCW
jgi:hypothetical protein